MDQTRHSIAYSSSASNKPGITVASAAVCESFRHGRPAQMGSMGGEQVNVVSAQVNRPQPGERVPDFPHDRSESAENGAPGTMVCPMKERTGYA